MPIPVFAPFLRPPDAGAVVLESDVNVGVEVAEGVGVLIEPVTILLVVVGFLAGDVEELAG